MRSDNAAAFRVKPEDAGIEFANVTELEKAATERLRKRLAMVLTTAELCQASHDRGEIIRIATFEFIEKIAHGTSSIVSFVKFYGELHSAATSILMYPVTRPETRR